MLVNIVVILCMILFFYARFGCELDIVMQTLLYGVNVDGKSMSHLMFSNILIGELLSNLINLFPLVAWYTYFHYLMIFISLVGISYVIVSYNESFSGNAEIKRIFKPKYPYEYLRAVNSEDVNVEREKTREQILAFFNDV